MVVATSCLDRVLHAIPAVDALPTWIHRTVETVGNGVFEKQYLMSRVDLVQLGGHVTNPEDPYTVVRERGGKARHVRQDRLATDRTKWRRKLEGILETHHFGVGHAE